MSGRPNGPVYNPDTKSYFEMVEYPYPVYRTWIAAKQEAESRTFKGVRGRLAVVTSQQVNDFLRDTFHPSEDTWIGLRYWCPYRKLQWVTGELHSGTAYSNWHPQWFNNPSIQCGAAEDDYMGVAYTPSGAEGFLWQAAGKGKGYTSYFVEYPTGKR